MTAPIATLVAARFRRRLGHALTVATAVAGAVALLGLMAGLSLVAQDEALGRRLEVLGEGNRIVRVTRYAASSIGHADQDAAAASALERLSRLDGVAGDLVRGVLMRPLRDDRLRVDARIVALDRPMAWTTLTEGRLPVDCSATGCEALLLSRATALVPLGDSVRVGDLDIELVGRGQLTSNVALGPLDQSGATPAPPAALGQAPDPPALLLLVPGVTALADNPAVGTFGRTYFWTRSLDAAHVRPWTTTALAGTVHAIERDVAASSADFTVTAPLPAIDEELARGAAGGTRLLLLGSLAAAVLLAFAVFAALVARADIATEYRRLDRSGARRGQLLGFVVLEAAVPVAIGAAAGWLLALGGASLLAVSQGVPAAPIVVAAAIDPRAVLPMVGLVIAAAAAVVIAVLPRRRAGRLGLILGTVALTTIVVLGWQLAAGGGVDAGDLRSGVASPIVVLLPAAAAFSIAALFLVAVPPALRWLARRSGRLPVAPRLTLLSVARDADRPTATLTLLTFSVGAMVFALGYGATLRAGIADQAAYAAGIDLRVSEVPTGFTLVTSVVPVDRYDALGDDVDAYPVLRRDGEAIGGSRVTLLGLPPGALPHLDGWRSDFSTVEPSELGRRIAMPGDWSLRGDPLPAGMPQLHLRATMAGDPFQLTIIIETLGGDFVQVPFGRIEPGTRTLDARLPAAAVGGTVVAAAVARDQSATGFHGAANGSRIEATIGLPDLPVVTGGGTVEVELSNAEPGRIVEAVQPADGLDIPAIVSPDLASLAGEDGTVAVRIGDAAVVTLRVAGVASRFPTVTDPDPTFAVADLEPLAAALNGARPGIAVPGEMWLDTPNAGRQAEVVGALEAAPFRVSQVISRSAIEAGLAGDPLSLAITTALVVAAAAGLALSALGIALGAAGDLRDETGDLADLEAQGVSPSAIRRHALSRTGMLVGGGLVGGVIAGAVLTSVVTGSVVLSAEAALPVPPLVPVVPWLAVVALIAGLSAAIALTILALARRSFGGSRSPDRGAAS